MRNQGKYQKTEAWPTLIYFSPCSENLYVLCTKLCLGDGDEAGRVPGLGRSQGPGLGRSQSRGCKDTGNHYELWLLQWRREGQSLREN